MRERGNDAGDGSHDSSGGLHDNLTADSQSADGATIPEAHLLFNPEFKRSGEDQNPTGSDGKFHVVVRDAAYNKDIIHTGNASAVVNSDAPSVTRELHRAAAHLTIFGGRRARFEKCRVRFFFADAVARRHGVVRQRFFALGLSRRRHSPFI
jgi:hypothetical protein